MRLEKNELMNVVGGAKGWIYAVIAGVGGLFALVTGIIDGYFNPQKCN